MNIDIYDYAKELDGNEHVSYYDVFKILLKDIDCIVCKKSVADLLGYSNGGFRKNIEVYTTKEYNLPYLKCHIVSDLSKIESNSFHEIRFLPIEKTIVEMLEDNFTDTQILLETMANYYCDHNDSYSDISPSLNILDKFNYYSKEAKKYYETSL